MQAAPESTLTVEYLLEGLMNQSMEIQHQILQQRLGQSMLPAGLFNNLRRAYDIMLEDLHKEAQDLERAISVLEEGKPECIAAAFAILTTPANVLGHINLLGSAPPVLH